MAGVWGVGFNHCGQIGPENVQEDASVRSFGNSSCMEVDESGSAAQCKLWKPNTCWRVKPIQLCPSCARPHHRTPTWLCFCFAFTFSQLYRLLSLTREQLQQLPMNSEDSTKWEVKEVCAGGDFTVVHGRCVYVHAPSSVRAYMCVCVFCTCLRSACMGVSCMLNAKWKHVL